MSAIISLSGTHFPDDPENKTLKGFYHEV